LKFSTIIVYLSTNKFKLQQMLKMPAIRGRTETNYITELMLSISFVMFNFNSSTIFQHLNQGSPRYLAPGGGLTLKILKIQGGGKLIGFNGQFIAKSP
jgi:hypothetical protein